MAVLDDPYRWLEDLDGPEVVAWIGERNAETLDKLSGDGRLREALREVLDSKERIAFPGWRGDGFYYNFWTDADHPRGLWRRTTAGQFRLEEPEWEVLIDVDALNRAEGANWTWGGAQVLKPGYDRCLVRLSRGGADATVVREFDLVARAFVDGFELPEAKSDVGWIDADHIYVGTDFGPGSLTSSGYARVVKQWRRGTPLTEAELVFEGEHDDVGVDAWHDPTPGFERDFVVRYLDIFRREYFLRRADGELERIDVPDDASCEAHREWLLIKLRSPWTVGDTTHPAGCLLVRRFGETGVTELFTPDEHTSLSSWAWTRHHLLITTMTDVKTRVYALSPGRAWQRHPVSGEEGRTWIVDTDPDRDDSYLIASEGFLRPTTLGLGAVGGPVEILKQEPALFDAGGLTVRQFFATSADGTRVPYFVVGNPAGPHKTIMTGYGGFEIPMLPGYDAVAGRGWLDGGGTYVVANIRGGGEYGPAWHRAALRENRVRAFEDFAAVAADLVTRGITTPSQLGITGGSNGGLLMGVMLTRYPELFGAVVARVPLLDMRRYTELLAGKSWIAEYGDPDVPADWKFLSAFSPYQNARADRAYPPALLLTSTRDDRVHPAHARKMAARLREQGHEVLYYENVEGGHGGAADNDQKATIAALTFEFFRRTLG
ncbi:prolyl oligopeptidase family serine peptidase [Actinoplanes sp. NPDC049596]|uniref:prolyl oligopeptidase family serine peptidase n=1 Tax=unclassified Actinoplanes TaxID=2626549 RepID=UPI00341B8D33